MFPLIGLTFLQPVFRELYNTFEGQLPNSEDLLSRHICLPCHPGISDKEVFHVVNTLRHAISSFLGSPKT